MSCGKPISSSNQGPQLASQTDIQNPIDQGKQETGNTSGQGNASVVPAEIRKWNWGAFLLSWIWGIGNKTYIALLTLIPYVGIIMAFVLGAKGSEWAWRNKRWESVEHFRRVQRKWAWWGVGIIPGIIILGIALAVAISMFKSNAQSANRDQVINYLNNLGAMAQQYYRKPTVMGGGGQSFAGFRLSDLGASNANGNYQIADGIPSNASYYNPSANLTANDPNSIVIVGWGEEIGNDGIHKVEACITVTQTKVISTVIN